MNIIHVPRRFVQSAWGGTETVVLELARRQVRNGDSAQILTSMALATSSHETIGGVDVRRFRHFYPYWRLSAEDRARMDRKGGNLVSFGLYRALLTADAPTVLHLHTGKRLGALVRSAAAIRGCPYVMQLHGGVTNVPAAEVADLADAGSKALEWGKVIGAVFGARRVLEAADAVICVDRFEAERLRETLPNSIVEFVPNAVDPDRFAADPSAGRAFRRSRGIPDTARVILCVGRIDPQKNQIGAVEVLRRVRDSGVDNAVLAFAGSATNPGYRDQVVAEVARHGLGEHVFFLGQLDYAGGDLAAAYAAGDCFLLPSIHEPFGVVVLEAWAAGLPVVAAAVGGVPAFVDHQRTGWLFAPERPADAVAGVLRVLLERSFADSLRDAASATVHAHYTWDVVTERVYGIYERALAKRRRP